jgi:acetolactate synthase-1/2/3 large subunit
MTDPNTGAAVAAETLAELTDRVYGLCGGHAQPIRDATVDTGAEIVVTRDERAAVHGAHGDGAVGGDLGVALVTARPGFTNALTGFARGPVPYRSAAPPRGSRPRAREPSGTGGGRGTVWS